MAKMTGLGKGLDALFGGAPLDMPKQNIQPQQIENNERMFQMDYKELGLTREDLVEMYRMMRLIRVFEENASIITQLKQEKDELLYEIESLGNTNQTLKKENEELTVLLSEAEVRKKLKSARYDQRLPEGIILVGGGAKMRDIDLFAKKSLEASVKIGTPQGLGGVADAIEKPEFATAVGLAMLAAEESQYTAPKGKKAKKALKMPKSGNFLKKIFSKF